MKGFSYPLIRSLYGVCDIPNHPDFASSQEQEKSVNRTGVSSYYGKHLNSFPIIKISTLPRPEYLSLVEILFPPLIVLILVFIAQPELFHQPVTVLPPLLPSSQHLSDINKEKGSLAIKLLGTQVGNVLHTFNFTFFSHRSSSSIFLSYLWGLQLQI